MPEACYLCIYVTGHLCIAHSGLDALLRATRPKKMPSKKSPKLTYLHLSSTADTELTSMFLEFQLLVVKNCRSTYFCSHFMVYFSTSIT